MSSTTKIDAPMLGNVVNCFVAPKDQVNEGDVLFVLEAMKVQHSVLAPVSGRVINVACKEGDMVEKSQPLATIDHSVESSNSSQAKRESDEAQQDSSVLAALRARIDKTLDRSRPEAVERRHAKGYKTARENLALLCDQKSFVEYGQLAIAAQRQRLSYEELQSTTAADGIITGIGDVNQELFTTDVTRTALIVNDYSVLAGTQGFFHHMKLDRMLAQALELKLPVIMYTEGGGGRPGDTDVVTVNSGLSCASFGSWAALSGIVPRIAVANGYNFAGNAALFGAADITIATQDSWIGMAGPAMIAGGGLGDFPATDIGPSAIQVGNGVIDILAEDEAHAASLAKQCLSYFQGPTNNYSAKSQETIANHIPENRRSAYDVRAVIEQLCDTNSVLELKPSYGAAIITAFARFEGKPVGLIANDCRVLGGAIDVDAGEKAADFMNLCNDFDLPVISLCDTPGFMVGPEHEEQGAVRRLAKLFTAGAKFKNTLIAVILRKCYGLGAQAMVGGSTAKPNFITSWPSGEFGPMGLEGAVKLGFKKELAAETDPIQREQLYDDLLRQQYQRGQAVEVATVMEIDSVIDPAHTRESILSILGIDRS